MKDLLSILIIKEPSKSRTEISRSLTQVGYQVESVRDGLQAQKKLRSAEYNLVLTTEQASGNQDRDDLYFVKRISPQIPVIILAENGTVDNAVKAMQAGASDYLLMPFLNDTIEKAVKKAIQFSNRNGLPKSNRNSLVDRPIFREIITRNRELEDILSRARSVAPSKATVLIQGESGTGKELLAAYVHHHSPDRQAPYVAVNCAALPESLAESELFGHERGSFTGALGRKIGKFELAKQGTVVLDEISEMPLPLQAKLLRVLQEKQIDRIGGTCPILIDARVIAISNVDLKSAVTEGKFRQDLYYRINVIPLTLPPLRERRDDIELLAGHFLEKHCLANQKVISRIDDNAMKILMNYDWQGNIRELENTIERAVLISKSRTILPENLLLDVSKHKSEYDAAISFNSGYTVRQMEKELIFKTLEDVNENRTHAAELLGISIRTLRNKLKEYREESDSRGVKQNDAIVGANIAAPNF